MRLYYRPACSLCEAMQRELAEHAARVRFELETVDIDTSEELVARYNHKVPVLTDTDDIEICHYFLDLQALEAYFSTL